MQSVRNIVAFATLVLISTSSVWANEAPQKELILIHISDTHEIMESAPHAVSIARFATRVHQIRAENPNAEVHVIHSGDFLAPSPTSRTLLGQDIVQALAEVGTELAAVGNHEFDYGAGVLLQRALQSPFPFLSANIRIGSTFGSAADMVSSNIHPYVVKEWAGKRIAFFALTTEATTMSTIRKFGDDAYVLSPATEGRLVVEQIRQAEDVDYVVALTHLRIQEEDALVRELNFVDGPTIDLMLGGHEHRVIQRSVYGFPHIKVRNDFQDMAVIRINQGGISWHVENLNRNIEVDASIEGLLNSFRGQVATIKNDQIGYLTESFDGTWPSIRSKYRTGELDLGSWVVGLFSEEMGVDIGFMNLGVVSRSNRVYGPGPITVSDVQALFPFIDPPVVIETSVRVLKDKFERMIEAGRIDHETKNWTGKFPVVSGLTARWDLTRPFGSRLTLTHTDGTQLSDDGILNVAVNLYIYNSDPQLQQSSRIIFGPNREAYEVLKDAIVRRYGAALVQQQQGGCEESLLPQK